MKTQFFLLCALATVLSEDIQCYDCNPKDDDQCIFPVENNAKSTFCKDVSKPDNPIEQQIADIDKTDIESRTAGPADPTPVIYECFSMYFKSDTDELQNGVYRGCTERNDLVGSSCEYLTERVKVGVVVNCTSCGTDRCNTHHVGAAHSLTVSLGVIIVNLILCVKVFSF